MGWTELWRPRFQASFVTLYKSLMWASVSTSTKQKYLIPHPLHQTLGKI